MAIDRSDRPTPPPEPPCDGPSPVTGGPRLGRHLIRISRPANDNAPRWPTRLRRAARLLVPASVIALLVTGIILLG